MMGIVNHFRCQRRYLVGCLAAAISMTALVGCGAAAKTANVPNDPNTPSSAAPTAAKTFVAVPLHSACPQSGDSYGFKHSALAGSYLAFDCHEPYQQPTFLDLSGKDKSIQIPALYHLHSTDIIADGDHAFVVAGSETTAGVGAQSATTVQETWLVDMVSKTATKINVPAILELDDNLNRGDSGQPIGVAGSTLIGATENSLHGIDLKTGKSWASQAPGFNGGGNHDDIQIDQTNGDIVTMTTTHDNNNAVWAAFNSSGKQLWTSMDAGSPGGEGSVSTPPNALIGVGDGILYTLLWTAPVATGVRTAPLIPLASDPTGGAYYTAYMNLINGGTPYVGGPAGLATLDGSGTLTLQRGGKTVTLGQKLSGTITVGTKTVSIINDIGLSVYSTSGSLLGAAQVSLSCPRSALPSGNNSGENYPSNGEGNGPVVANDQYIVVCGQYWHI